MSGECFGGMHGDFGGGGDFPVVNFSRGGGIFFMKMSYRKECPGISGVHACPRPMQDYKSTYSGYDLCSPG